MENVLSEVIKALAEKAKSAAAVEAHYYTQSALNLAYALQVMEQTSKLK